ncbi:hypothetical protein E4K67_22355 [Desulfosporosinus fructosivorans]|uniref:Uncharacterized protein n=1 Tax=Desulfosporosinus fructosivorans TaxID=2018669 RepID=A0A4Z0R0Y6_9FIRM|nr:hypothetical protein [Desulfosporosinus fructosivorans]TGE35863.1 hypothetical protein E4K67_22355 [Desulfosporosinus fructosivorans]
MKLPIPINSGIPYIGNLDSEGNLAIPTEQYILKAGIYLPVSATNPLPTSLFFGLANEPIRKTLVANTDTLFTFSALCKKFDILNIGPGDIYYRVDAVPTVNGATSILIPAAMGYTAEVQGTVIHVISSVASVVQIVGVR